MTTGTAVVGVVHQLTGQRAETGRRILTTRCDLTFTARQGERSAMTTRPRDCMRPPPDDTPEREAWDRFSTFLRVAGPAPTHADIEAGRTTLRTPRARYEVKFLAWHLAQPIAPPGARQ